jgi:hypothetical protein
VKVPVNVAWSGGDPNTKSMFPDFPPALIVKFPDVQIGEFA